MSKRHTPSRTLTQKPRMVNLMVLEEAHRGNPMGWQLMTLEDAKLLAEVLRLEGKQVAILG